MEERTELGRKAYELGIGLGGLGTVLIGAAGGTLGAALARCVGCGAALTGAEARFHDGSCEACGVWLAEYYGLPSAVFVRQSGSDVCLSVRDGQGRRAAEGLPRPSFPCTGGWDMLTGADSGWAARRMAGACSARTVAAEGPPALRFLLERMGCDVLDRPRSGIPLLRSDREGFRLTVCVDGTAQRLPGRDALAAAAQWLTCGRSVPTFKTELI